jgi:hypothetical protein
MLVVPYTHILILPLGTILTLGTTKMLVVPNTHILILTLGTINILLVPDTRIFLLTFYRHCLSSF